MFLAENTVSDTVVPRMLSQSPVFLVRMIRRWSLPRRSPTKPLSLALFISSHFFYNYHCWKYSWNIKANREVSALFLIRMEHCFWSVHHHYINCTHNIYFPLYWLMADIIYFTYLLFIVISFIVAKYFWNIKAKKRQLFLYNSNITIFLISTPPEYKQDS